LVTKGVAIVPLSQNKLVSISGLYRTGWFSFQMVNAYGHMQLILTLEFAHSLAAALVNPTTACFDAE
jgi:hypothetical protein